MKKGNSEVILKIVGVLFFLYIFLLSIALMGAAFKGFGKGFAENLISTTSNPFVGLFIGILATSLVQSSSTTTSIVVGIVGSGQLSVGNAIPIIMGANIGTTVTNTLVSLGHVGQREEFKRAISGATVHDFFNFICVAVMFPLEITTHCLEKSATLMSTMFSNVGGVKFTSPIKMIVKPAVGVIQNISTGIFSESKSAAYIVMLALSAAFLFVALYYIVKIMKSLVVNRAEIVLNNVIARNSFMALVAGLAFTIFVQSSSITTSLLIPMVASGVLTVEGIFPITMGANIGTTTTAILASFATGNISAIIIAFVHFLFNLVGVFCLYPIKPLRRVPLFLAHWLGDVAYKNRAYAFAYVLGVFFLLPTVLIFISKILK
ncbi:MAG: Na/Pi symporter [Planctomycetes bacterium]|nr:Na/Pi symporter [Planctomycetota bacterium]